MTRIWPLVFFIATGCSTLSQTIETPVVLPKKKVAVGGGSVYSHNINQNDVAENDREEFTPSFYLGGRYGLGKDFEVALTGGSYGLTNGSGLDLRIRWQFWNGWRYPEEELEAAFETEDFDDDEDPKAKGKKGKKGKEPNREPDSVGADGKPFITDGWVSSASLGAFWAGFNQLENYSTDQYETGVYLSNSWGYKKRGWVYYFGWKVIMLETEYRHKTNRFATIYDVDRKYDELTYGAFLGFTYTWYNRKNHGFVIDTLISGTQLPKSAMDTTTEIYPALTLSFWYID